MRNREKYRQYAVNLADSILLDWLKDGYSLPEARSILRKRILYTAKRLNSIDLQYPAFYVRQLFHWCVMLDALDTYEERHHP